MPTYQVIVEFWAESDNKAGHVVGAAKSAIERMTSCPSTEDQDEFVMGDVEIVSLRNCRPVDALAYPGVPAAVTS